MRALLVVNPASRRGVRLQSQALAAFRDAGVPCDAVVTERAGHAAELARALAPGYDLVFTLGGDGTAIEVVGALAGSGRPVGILPGGTGNLVARTLGIPLDVRRAARALLAGDAVPMDLGALGSGRRFAFAAGVGIDARMIERTSHLDKRRFGVAAYAVSATRAIVERERFAIRATVDGEVIEREGTAVMVANFGAVLRDLLTFGPGIRSDDGLLDLCLFSPRTMAEGASVMWRLFRGDHSPHPALTYRKGREFVIETDPVVTAQADGELVGTTPLTVRVEPLAALLLVPEGV